MKDLISVVVPIYNVEKYLPKCVESICGQTYRNLEIILVDDGSPDQCGKLCDDYAKMDERIKVIHKKNGGLSDARNAGIEVATGKYIGFVDSDDYIHPQMYELLYDSLQKDKTCIAVCAFQSIQESEHVETKVLNSIQAEVISSETERINCFFEKNYEEFTVAWNKLYPMEYFSDIRYPKGKIHEDEFTTYKLLEKAQSISFVREPLYYYVQRGNSIMGEAFNEKRLHRLEAYQERLDQYWHEKRFVWFERILFLYRIFLLRYEKSIEGNESLNAKMLRPYKAQYNDWVCKSILKLPVSLNAKMGYMAYALIPGLYRKR